MSLKVLKFGGSSLGSAEALRRAAAIVRDELPSGGLVVVSALRGTTDLILEACAAAGRGDLATAQSHLAAIRERHFEVAAELGLIKAMKGAWSPLFARLDQLLTGMAMLGEATPRGRDAALAVGETLSANLAALCFNGTFREVREVMKTDARFGKARPQLEALRAAAAPWRKALSSGVLWVTQGFLGSSPEGVTTTLGRGGSDTSATLLGEALDADEVQIWTDVDGVLTADPSLVGEGLRADPLAALRHLAALGQEPVGGLLTGSSTVSIAFLVPESRLGDLIPRLHDRCVLGWPDGRMIGDLSPDEAARR